MPTSKAAKWKKLYTEALSAQTRSQKLIAQARKAILDRTIEIAAKNNASECRALETALRRLWKAESVRPKR